jgi:hypothetical protein
VKQITYIESELLTDDTVADLLIEYAKTLALNGKSDTVDIPAIGHDGIVHMTTLLIGPASQLIVTDLDVPERPDLDARAAIEDLRARIDRFRPRPVLSEDPDALQQAHHEGEDGILGV